MTERPTPNANTYWVSPAPNTPGALLAGEYPGEHFDDEARPKLARYLDCGVTAFLDLTQVEDGLSPYDGLVAALASARAADVVYRRMSIQDLNVPERAEHMEAILAQLDAWLAAGRHAYVHCWGGVGRTGTVVGCHLVRHGLTGDAALAQVAQLWTQVSEDKRRRHPRSPQTDAQRAYVLGWPGRLTP
jgi:protein-tyrosine phosphatase